MDNFISFLAGVFSNELVIWVIIFVSRTKIPVITVLFIVMVLMMHFCDINKKKIYKTYFKSSTPDILI